MAELGRSTPQSNAPDSNPDGVLVVSKHKAPASGPLGLGRFWLTALGGSGARSQKARMVIFANAADAVGAFLGGTAEVTVNETTQTGAWVDCPAWVGAPPAVVAGTDYWIGLWWGTVVNAAAITIPRLPGPDPQFFNVAEVYSGVGAPPNTLATAGPARTYSLFFYIQSGLINWIRARLRQGRR